MERDLGKIQNPFSLLLKIRDQKTQIVCLWLYDKLVVTTEAKMGSSNNAVHWVPPGEGYYLPVVFETKKKFVCSYFLNLVHSNR